MIEGNSGIVHRVADSVCIVDLMTDRWVFGVVVSSYWNIVCSGSRLIGKYGKSSYINEDWNTMSRKRDRCERPKEG